MIIPALYVLGALALSAAIGEAWRTRNHECATDRALRKTNRSYGYM